MAVFPFVLQETLGVGLVDTAEGRRWSMNTSAAHLNRLGLARLS